MNRWARGPLPLSGAVCDGQALWVRLSGERRALAEARAAMGALDQAPEPGFWEAVREQRLPFFRDDRPLWRIPLPPATLALHSGVGVGHAVRWRPDQDLDLVGRALAGTVRDREAASGIVDARSIRPSRAWMSFYGVGSCRPRGAGIPPPIRHASYWLKRYNTSRLNLELGARPGARVAEVAQQVSQARRRDRIDRK